MCQFVCFTNYAFFMYCVCMYIYIANKSLLLLLFNPDRRKSKLSALYAGPFKITAVWRNMAYVVPIDQLGDRPKSEPFEWLSLCYPELPDRLFEGRPGELVQQLQAEQGRPSHWPELPRMALPELGEVVKCLCLVLFPTVWIRVPRLEIVFWCP